MAQEQSLLPWVHSLFNIGQSLTHESSERLRQQLLDHIVAGFDAVSGSIALLNEDLTGLILVAGSGSAAKFIGAPISMGEGVMGWVVKEAQPLLLAGDISRDLRFKGLKLRSDPSRPLSALCWPLIVEGSAIGAVSINRDVSRAPFTEQDLTDGHVMISLVSLVVDNMRMYEEQRKRIQELGALNGQLEQRQRELRQEHAARTASETRLSAILDIAPAAIIVVDAEQRIQVFNKGAEHTFGYTVDEAYGQSLERLLPERDADDHRHYMQSLAVTAGMNPGSGERREVLGMRKDGTEFPASVSISRVVVDGSLYFIVMLRDLTYEKASARMLSEALQDRQTIMDTLQDIIFKIDMDARLVSWNRRAELVTGYSASELTAHCAYEFVLPQEKEAVLKFIHTAAVEGTGELQAHLVSKDGSQVLYHWIGTALKDGQGHVVGVTGTARDITVAKQLETALRKEKEEQQELIKKLQEAQGQLLQSEKMASIGQLAAGVAHEINNPVGYVSSNLGALQNYVADLLRIIDAYERIEALVEPQAPALAQVRALKQHADLEFLRHDAVSLMSESMEGVTRVKKIVQDLKDFSHVDSAEWQWADLHKGIDSTLNIVHNEVKYKSTVLKEYGKIPEVECIASQVNQVFMNILVNAAHAIETRGTITIRSGLDNDAVWVEIADTGKGIPAENLARIFDPFFTTKPVGKGTGLGLSLSYGIVQKHHGRIEVKSEVGKGTAFKVWLPVRQPEQKAAA